MLHLNLSPSETEIIVNYVIFFLIFQFEFLVEYNIKQYWPSENKLAFFFNTF